jgi:hypothetical protein
MNVKLNLTLAVLANFGSGWASAGHLENMKSY